MAKSFRNTNAKAIDTKKDFLDLLEEGKPTTNLTVSKVESVKTNIVSTEQPTVIRQTFMIGPEYLDKMKDLVYTKRRGGEFEYSQKDAIHDALDLLFAQNKIDKRPNSVREKEEKRNSKIREGRR